MYVYTCPNCHARIRDLPCDCDNQDMSKMSETPEYDPRHDRAQSIEGAKARYADHENDYSILNLEEDLERLLDSSDGSDSISGVDRRTTCHRCNQPSDSGLCSACRTEADTTMVMRDEKNRERPVLEGQEVLR